MIIIPAVDIKEGKVVRLYQGDFSQEEVYFDNPAEAALKWQDEGAEILHLVDLDGALTGEPRNRDLVIKIIKEVKIPCQVGGGLRGFEDIQFMLDVGATRVIVGTRAVESYDFILNCVERFAEKFAVGIDARGAEVASEGWSSSAAITPFQFAQEIASLGVKTIIFTDIAKDGTLLGPNIEAIKEILSGLSVNLIASGGIGSLEDIKKLKEIAGLYGVIVGKALYANKFTLKDAMEIAKE